MAPLVFVLNPGLFSGCLGFLVVLESLAFLNTKRLAISELDSGWKINLPIDFTVDERLARRETILATPLLPAALFDHKVRKRRDNGQEFARFFQVRITFLGEAALC